MFQNSQCYEPKPFGWMSLQIMTCKVNETNACVSMQKMLRHNSLLHANPISAMSGCYTWSFYFPSVLKLAETRGWVLPKNRQENLIVSAGAVICMTFSVTHFSTFHFQYDTPGFSAYILLWLMMHDRYWHIFSLNVLRWPSENVTGDWRTVRPSLMLNCKIHVMNPFTRNCHGFQL